MKREWADLVNFEGNANAIRVLAQQQQGKDAGGIQLTFSTLALQNIRAKWLQRKRNHSQKEIRFFQNEKRYFPEIAKGTQLISESEEPYILKGILCVAQKQLTISVINIIDMEDAHRLGIVSQQTAKPVFRAGKIGD